MKKYNSLVYIIICISILLSNSVAYAVESPKILLDKSNSAVIGICATSAFSKKIKVEIEKNGEKYYYNINNLDEFEYFPLQMGSGDYQISILENVRDNKYRYVYRDNINYAKSDKNEVYVSSSQLINWDFSDRAIITASILTKELKTEVDKIEGIYNYLIDRLSYDYDKHKYVEYDYIPSIDLINDTKSGICFDFASLLAAMLRSQNIPTRLVMGYSKDIDGYHAWNEVFLKEEGRWMVIDITSDTILKENGMSYTMEKQAELYKGVKVF